MADVSPGVIFLLILCAVPLQLYLSPKSTSEIKYHLQRATDGLISFTRGLGIVLPGTEDRIIKNVPIVGDNMADIGGEDSESVQTQYGMSLESRLRPPTVQFKVGDVVKHKVHGYRGVIIGWDERAIAPQEWLKKMYTGNEADVLEPHYAVIVDTRDYLIPQQGYLTKSNIELTTGQVYHPLVKKYFEFFDHQKQRYSMKPWVQQVYPDD